MAPPKRGAVLFGLGTPGFDWAEGGDFFAFGLLAFARGWLGGGDVKVMTDCACWAALGTLAALIAIAGGVLALVLMLLRCGLALICPMPWALLAAWRCGLGASCRCPDGVRPVARMSRHEFDISQPPKRHLTVTMP